jgi:hypothetical protein
VMLASGHVMALDLDRLGCVHGPSYRDTPPPGRETLFKARFMKLTPA